MDDTNPNTRGRSGLVFARAGGGSLERELEFYPTPVHSEAAHLVIAAELVACTLGVRVRPELQMTVGAQAAAALDRLQDRLYASIARQRASNLPG